MTEKSTANSSSVVPGSEVTSTLRLSKSDLEKLIKERTGALEAEIAERERISAALRASEERFRLIAETVDDLIAVLDLEGKREYVNPSFSRIFGRAEDLFGTDALGDVHPEDRDRIRKVFDRTIETGKGSRAEYRFLLADGKERFLESQGSTIKDRDGKVQKVVVVSRDVTDRIYQEEKLKKTHEDLQVTVKELQRHIEDTIHLLEMSEFLQECETEEDVYKILTQSAGKLFSDTVGTLFIWDEKAEQFCEALSWPSHSPRQKAFNTSDCRALKKGKALFVKDVSVELSCNHVSSRKSPYICIPLIASGFVLGTIYIRYAHSAKGQTKDRNKQIAWLESRINLISTVADRIALSITNLRLREKLKKEALRCPVTGLFNRRYFEETLHLELERCARTKQTLGIIMVDIDHFKKVNDTYGHSSGDLVLREVGELLQRNIRGADIACRFGGEEFVLVLAAPTEEVIADRAEKLRAAMKAHKHILPDNRTLVVTASFGVAFPPRHGKTLTELIKSADKALYDAKGGGRDKVVISRMVH